MSMYLLPCLACATLTSNVEGPPRIIELDEAAVIIEINATDGDAGIHFFLDGEGWQEMTITGPGGTEIIDVDLAGSLGVQGLTELFSESSEPSFKEQPLEDFLALFPPGLHTFSGVTTEGDILVGEAMLTHALPEAPTLISPPLDVPVNLNSLAIAWEPVADPDGSEIIAYQVILEISEEPLRELVLDLTADVTVVQIPAALLEPDTEYKFEVLVREESGNQTITEATFMTAPDDAETCLADLNGDGDVGPVDLALLLTVWGSCR